MTRQNDKISPLSRLEDYSDLHRDPFRLAYDSADKSLPIGVASRGIASRPPLYLKDETPEHQA